MPPKRKGTSGAIPLTPYEEELLTIAVRLDSAVRYWEKQLHKGEDVDAMWMTEGFGNELVCFKTSLLAEEMSNYAT
jgi:hypothetical protein